MEDRALIACDDEAFVPGWVLPLWPQIRPQLIQRLHELPAMTRDLILVAIASGPGALAFRAVDDAVFVGCGSEASGFLILEFDLVDVMPPDDARTH
jgi:hypothetical protein